MHKNILEVISKEDILNLHPSNKDVLAHHEKKADRIARLAQALHDASRHYKRATVTFQTDEGTKQVTATIWAMTDKSIVFKGGITIPVCSILDVE